MNDDFGKRKEPVNRMAMAVQNIKKGDYNMYDYDSFYYPEYESNENKVNTLYSIKGDTLEIDFLGWKPDHFIRDLMKSVKLRWSPAELVWYGPVNAQTLAVAKRICAGQR